MIHKKGTYLEYAIKRQMGNSGKGDTYNIFQTLLVLLHISESSEVTKDGELKTNTNVKTNTKCNEDDKHKYNNDSDKIIVILITIYNHPIWCVYD